MRRTARKGSGQFEQISWDEALTENLTGIAGKRLLNEYGPQAPSFLIVISRNQGLVQRLNGGMLFL